MDNSATSPVSNWQVKRVPDIVQDETSTTENPGRCQTYCLIKLFPSGQEVSRRTLGPGALAWRVASKLDKSNPVIPEVSH